MSAWKNFFRREYPELNKGLNSAGDVLSRIPIRDRFAALIAWMYDGSNAPTTAKPEPASESLQVCRKVPGSGDYNVCAIDVACIDKDRDTIFSGRDRFTWDFCANEGWGGDLFQNNAAALSTLVRKGG